MSRTDQASSRFKSSERSRSGNKRRRDKGKQTTEEGKRQRSKLVHECYRFGIEAKVERDKMADRVASAVVGLRLPPQPKAFIFMYITLRFT
jgi:hypothetical protein